MAPFDLSSDLMLRAFLYRLSAGEHVLLLIMHHIATDGWSMNILLQEMAAFYNAAVEDEEGALEPLPWQYADFATWQRSDLDEDVTARELAYWKEQLQDAPTELGFPLDRRRSVQQDYHGDRITMRMPSETAEAIHTVARSQRATPFMMLLSALYVVLRRYNDQQDICIGVPIAGRSDPRVEAMIGFFVNMLVIREKPAPSLSFTDLLQSVRKTCLDAYDHQHLPFEQLVALMRPERSLNRTPYFQVSLAQQPGSDAEIAFSGLQVEPIRIPAHPARFDLGFSTRRTAGTYDVSLTYPTQLFNASAMHRLLGQYLHACSWVAGHLEEPIGRAELAPSSATLREALDGAKRDTHKMDLPSVVAAFRKVVRESPMNIALEQATDRLTYGALDEASDSLAEQLADLGVSHGEAVGVYLRPRIKSVPAYLAILKCGASYVPLDTNAPDSRTLQLLQAVDVRRVITTARNQHLFQERGFEPISIEAISKCQNRGSRSPRALPEVSAADSAYIIFTSGSAGQPKGVRIPHRGITRLVLEPDYVVLGAETRLAHLASPSFDAATFEIWGPLLNGGTCILPEEPLPSVSRLGNLIRRFGINTLWLTSAWFNAIVDEDISVLKPLEQLLVGGEALSVPHVRRALVALPDTRLINGYGPTENTTFSCCFTIPRTLHPRSPSVPIGRPISGTYAYVLDEQLRPLPLGVPGELCLGGDGLALGYVGDEPLTSARFVPDPLSNDAAVRIYRTGDRVRVLPSGDLEFLRRMDRQLKVRGFRVEPGEIEFVLSQHPSVRDGHVVLRSGSDGAPATLIAYVLSEAGLDIDPQELRLFLGARLPDYMVPSIFVEVAGFPRTISGKIDEKALREPGERMPEVAGAERPQTVIEKRLAAIWSHVLGVAELSVNSSFFELGGHSLLAVRLIAQVESAFRITLPLAVLFEAATISSLAKRIEELGSGSPRSTVVPLRAGGDATPFFGVPPAGASVYHFSDLVRHLAPEIPFYGIQPMGLEPGELPARTVEEMAARYVHDLRLIRPRGPYALGGRCFGAFVAFEMAQLLMGAGEEVSLLVLMDPSAPPGVSRDARYYAGRVGYFRRRRALIPAIRTHLRVRVSQSRKSWLNGLVGSAPARRLARSRRAHRRAQDAYRPRPYAGDITFLGARDEHHREETRDLWQQLAMGRLDIQLVPGTHRTITQAPNLDTFARRLEQLILESQASTASACENDTS